MTDLHPWVYNLVLVMLGVVTLAWLVWCLKGDRARGRKRCPRCWYDLGPQATPAVLEGLKQNGLWSRLRRARAWRQDAALGESCGVRAEENARAGSAGPLGGRAPGAFVRCPECGATVTRVRQLKRTRRRPRLALLAVLPVLIGSQIAMFPLRPDKGWTRWVPTTVLMAIATPNTTGVSHAAGFILGPRLDSSTRRGACSRAIIERLPHMWSAHAAALCDPAERVTRAEMISAIDAPTRVYRGSLCEVRLKWKAQSEFFDRTVTLSAPGCSGEVVRDVVLSPSIGLCGNGLMSMPEWDPRIEVLVPEGAFSTWTMRLRIRVNATVTWFDERPSVHGPEILMSDVPIGMCDVELTYEAVPGRPDVLTLVRSEATRVRVARRPG